MAALAARKMRSRVSERRTAHVRGVVDAAATPGQESALRGTIFTPVIA
jgi:hypothetical protein